MPVGSETKWNAARKAATTLSPAEDWRRDLASAVCEAARAEFVSIMTCPPADWSRFRFTTYPDDHASLVTRIDRDFKPRIDAVGEGWQQAVRTHGRVYTPLEVVAARPLAEELRDAVMRPADIDGYVVAFLLDRSEQLVGMAALGARCEPGELLSRVVDPLQQITSLAGSTLGGALDLARACSASSPLPSPSPSSALAALSSRAHGGEARGRGADEPQHRRAAGDRGDDGGSSSAQDLRQARRVLAGAARHAVP
jgi:hypothetical protein